MAAAEAYGGSRFSSGRSVWLQPLQQAVATEAYGGSRFSTL
jgi:hypothetical protein